MNPSNPENLTQYIAVFAATLAAINIFNAYINKPFILEPLSDSVSIFKKQCDKIKEGLKLPFSKEQIETKKKLLSGILIFQRCITFLYNSIVLILWGSFTYKLIKLEKKEELNVECFLNTITISTFVVVLLGFILRISVYFISQLKEIENKDKENLLEANKIISKEKTESGNIS